MSEQLSELILQQIQIGPMQNFVYVIGSASTRDVVLIDPAWDINGLLEHVRGQDLNPVGALVTHYHADHCGGSIRGHRIEGVAHLLEDTGMKVYVNKHEADGLKQVTGLQDSDLAVVDTGDTMRVGEIEIEFLHTPGHTPGSQCFRIKDTLVSGDTLFVQGCGRVDLPGSNIDDMHASLCKLADLPDQTVLYPGHHYGEEPNASMGYVKQRNFHLRVPDLETWRKLMERG
ncbi:MAG: MBL fold metallo-hydrolase [Gammaproteobacteria bacterium]|nr:MBL fold metallo-hydrolase [Gammaproteobacteria bacterium]